MDNNPNGELLETPDGSQPERTTAGQENEVNLDGASNATPEEVAFNSLKGSTQERVRTLANRANQVTQLQSEMAQMRQELEAQRLRSMTPQQTFTPDVQDAVSKLDQFGMATKDYTNKAIEEKVSQQLSGLVWKMEMDRLESRYNGSNGLPAFDRAEYEAYIGTNPQYRNYSPDDVYSKMFEDEIFDARVKGLGTKPQVKQSPNLRATRTRVQEEMMTPEYIEQRLAQPDGKQWYEQNLQKINSVLARSSSAE